jgi:hypothetical protein
LSAIRAKGKTAEHTHCFKISYKGHHRHFRLLISGSYSGLMERTLTGTPAVHN